MRHTVSPFDLGQPGVVLLLQLLVVRAWYKEDDDCWEESGNAWEELKSRGSSSINWRKREKRKKPFYKKRKIMNKEKKLKEELEKRYERKEIEDGTADIKIGERVTEKYQTIIFLQHTAHSELATRVREKLSELEKVGKVKVKIVERCGDKLVDLLHKSNVCADLDCGRDNCWPCK